MGQPLPLEDSNALPLPAPVENDNESSDKAAESGEYALTPSLGVYLLIVDKKPLEINNNSNNVLVALRGTQHRILALIDDPDKLEAPEVKRVLEFYHAKAVYAVRIVRDLDQIVEDPQDRDCYFREVNGEE